MYVCVWCGCTYVRAKLSRYFSKVHIYSIIGLVVKFPLAMREPRVRSSITLPPVLPTNIPNDADSFVLVYAVLFCSMMFYLRLLPANCALCYVRNDVITQCLLACCVVRVSTTRHRTSLYDTTRHFVVASVDEKEYHRHRHRHCSCILSFSVT